VDEEMSAYVEDSFREKRLILKLVLLRVCTCPDFETRWHGNANAPHHRACIKHAAQEEIDRLDSLGYGLDS
jgi:hypothetical protein